MRIEPEISGVNVVLLGSFNPTIFTPAWFALNELLPQHVVDCAKTDVVHPEVTEFSIDWLKLHIRKNLFLADTSREPYVRMRDLVFSVFNEFLPHTPISALGINRQVHFRVANQATRDRIGRKLVPVEPWGKCGDELEISNESGGMKSVTMAQGRPRGRPVGGEVNVTVEPSNRINNGQFGIFVRVNDHFVLGEDDYEGRIKLLGFLADHFESSIKRSDEIIDHIMSLGETKEGEAL